MLHTLHNTYIQYISNSNNFTCYIGRMLNIDLVGQNVEFLGDWFGEVEKEVILPAKMSKKEDKIAISTRKFVRVKNGEEPKLTIQIHEKLIGDDKPQDATISSIEKIGITYLLKVPLKVQIALMLSYNNLRYLIFRTDRSKRY